MKIGIDMDGVLADFTGAAIRRIDEYFGVKIGYNELIQPSIGNILYNRLTKSERQKYNPSSLIYKDISPPGFFYEIEPYEGVINTLKALDKVHNVVIITKPLEWNNCPGEKHAWLKKHLGYKPKIMMVDMANTKGMVAVDVMIDDDPRVIKSLEFAIPIVIEHPWNKKFLELEAVRSVKTFNDVPNVIQEISESFYDPKIMY